MNVKQIFTRSYLAYALLLAGILSLVLAIFGPLSHGFAGQTFDVLVLVSAIVAFILNFAAFAVGFKWAPLVAAAFSAMMLGFTLYHALPIFADHINDLNFQNGTFGPCVVYVLLSGIACVLDIVASFDPKK